MLPKPHHHHCLPSSPSQPPPPSCILCLPFSFHYSLFLWSIYHSPAIYFFRLSLSLFFPSPTPSALHLSLHPAPPAGHRQVLQGERGLLRREGRLLLQPDVRRRAAELLPGRDAQVSLGVALPPRRSSFSPTDELTIIHSNGKKQQVPVHHKLSASTLSWQTCPPPDCFFSARRRRCVLHRHVCGHVITLQLLSLLELRPPLVCAEFNTF